MDIKIDINVNVNGMPANVDLTEIMDLLKRLVKNQKEVSTTAPAVKEVPTSTTAVIPVPRETEKKDTRQKRHVVRMVKKASEQNINDLLVAAELLDDEYEGKNLSYLAFCSRVIKTSGVPLCTINTLKKLIGDKFDFQSYHRTRQQNTPELCREAAMLLYSGITVNIASIITEQYLDKAGFSYVVSLAKPGFTQDELDSTYKKYKKELLVYGVEGLTHDEHWLDNIINNRSITYKTQSRLKYTPDQVGRLVYAYEDAVEDGLTGQHAIFAASKKVNLSGAFATLKRALFDHERIPGYQHIKTPTEVRTNTDVKNPTKLFDVRTVKFLNKKRGWSHDKIARELGLARQTVASICRGITWSQVVVDAETERILEARYPVEKSNNEFVG